MPLVKPQDLKSLKTIALQPDKISSKIEVIMLMEIAGKGTGQIAEALGMTDSRISIIRHSPLYRQQLEVEKEKLKGTFRERQAERIINDPVVDALKGAALSAAHKKIDLMTDGKSEFVQLAAAGDILDRAGYKAHQDKTVVRVEVSEKMAERFERALKYDSNVYVGGQSASTLDVKVSVEDISET